MSGTSEDDRASVDRAFAALVAGYHLTADRPDPLPQPARVDHLPVEHLPSDLPSDAPGTEPVPGDEGPGGQVRAEPSPTEPSDAPTDGPQEAAPSAGFTLFRFPETAAGPEQARSRDQAGLDEVDEVDTFLPGPPMPIPRPAWPVLVAWIAMGYAVLVVLAISVGIRLPSWVGWLALVGFVGGFGTLVSRLPRHRPPDAGDGAVL